MDARTNPPIEMDILPRTSRVELLLAGLGKLRVDDDGNLTDTGEGHLLDQFINTTVLQGRASGSPIRTDIQLWLGGSRTLVEEAIARGGDPTPLYSGSTRVRSMIKRLVRKARHSLVMDAVEMVLQDLMNMESLYDLQLVYEVLSQTRLDSRGNTILAYDDILVTTTLGQLLREVRFADAVHYIEEQRALEVDRFQDLRPYSIVVVKADFLAAQLLDNLPEMELRDLKARLEVEDQGGDASYLYSLYRPRLVRQYGRSLAELEVPVETQWVTNYWGVSGNVDFLRSALDRWRDVVMLQTGGAGLPPLGLDLDEIVLYCAIHIESLINERQSNLYSRGLLMVHNDRYLHTALEWLRARVARDVEAGTITEDPQSKVDYRRELLVSPDLRELLVGIGREVQARLATRAIRLVVGHYASREPELQPVADLLVHPRSDSPLYPLAVRSTAALLEVVFDENGRNRLGEDVWRLDLVVADGAILDTLDDSMVRAVLLSTLIEMRR